MSIAFVNAGSVVTSTLTTLNVPYPGTVTAGNILLLCIHTKYSDDTPQTPAGWTQINQKTGGNGAEGADSGPMILTVYYKIASGSETGNQTVTMNNAPNTNMGVILQYQKSMGDWDIASTTGEDTTAGTSWSVTGAADPGMNAGDMVLAVMSQNGNLALSWTSEAMSQSGVTYGTAVERVDNASSSGSDSCMVVSEHPVSSGSSTGAPTFTMTGDGSGANSPTGPGIIIRLREAVVDNVPQPEYAQVDETYHEEHSYDGFTAWLMPEDVIILDQIWAELPIIDETYDQEYDYGGWVQSPLAEDNDVAAARAETAQVDEAYDEAYDYAGFSTWQMPENVEDFQAIPELAQVDETYDQEHDYTGFAAWQMPENVEDFQPLAELPVVDETYDLEHDYAGFVAWQTPENVEDFQPLAELPTVDETYDEAHDFNGFATWQMATEVLEDFQPLAELPIVDETYEEAHDYNGFAMWQVPEDVFPEGLLAAELPQVDEAYDEAQDFSGFTAWQVPDNIEDFQSLAELPIIDETYDETYSHDFSGFVFWLAPDDIEEPLLGVTELPQVDENYDLYVEFLGWQTVIVEEPPLEEPMVLPELPQIDLYYEAYFDFSGWQFATIETTDVLFGGAVVNGVKRDQLIGKKGDQVVGVRKRQLKS